MEAFLKDAYEPSSTFESLYHAHKEFVDAFDGEIMDHKDVQKTFPHLFDATGPRKRSRSKPRGRGRVPPLRRSDYMKMLAILALLASAAYLGHRSEQQLRGGVQIRHRRTDPLKKVLYDMEQASCDDLSSTYRKAALQTHPDKKGGDNDAFRRLNKKYKDEQRLCRRGQGERIRRNNRRNPGRKTRRKHRGRMEEESTLRF